MIHSGHHRWIWGILACWHLAISCLIPALHHCDVTTQSSCHCSCAVLPYLDEVCRQGDSQIDEDIDSDDPTMLPICLACVFQAQCQSLEGPVLDMPLGLGDDPGYRADLLDDSVLIQAYWQWCIARRGPPLHV